MSRAQRVDVTTEYLFTVTKTPDISFQPEEELYMKFLLAAFLVVFSVLSVSAQKIAEQQQQQIPLTALDEQTCTVTTLDRFRSLVVTDQEVLDRFPLRDVLQTIIDRANVQNTTPDSLWSQWWSALRPRQAGDPSNEPHCDDNGGTINGYAIECPRTESILESELPETHEPVAVFNRFDLAPFDGSNCGEYRLVYAKTDGSLPGRNFIIFEGVLPNPNPEDGACGCKPVAEFWADLSFNNNVVDRADQIEDFFYNGLPGFQPVIRPEAYGLGGTVGGYSSPGRTTGQIRTNMFMQGPWMLREFGLERKCTNVAITQEVQQDARAQQQQQQQIPLQKICKLIVVPRPVANNPHPDEWLVVDAAGTTFQNTFVANMGSLIPTPDGINQISMFAQPDFDAGESNSQSFLSQYNPSTTFATLINNGLGGTPFNATHMALRATTQSCAGCHMQSSNDNLGNGVIWPAKSPAFVHVTEGSGLSNALTMTGGFLDHRQAILEEFLGFACNTGPCPAIIRNVKGDLQLVEARSSDDFETLGGSITH